MNYATQNDFNLIKSTNECQLYSLGKLNTRTNTIIEEGNLI